MPVKIKKNLKFAKMVKSARKTIPDMVEVTRLIAYEKIHGRNPSSRMFCYFKPSVNKKTAISNIENYAREINGKEGRFITIRQLNKCLGFRGNDIRAVRRALEEMRIVRKNVKATVVDADVIRIKRKNAKPITAIDYSSAYHVIEYIYDNQEIWDD